jgi:hypothetical protein
VLVLGAVQALSGREALIWISVLHIEYLL